MRVDGFCLRAKTYTTLVPSICLITCPCVRRLGSTNAPRLCASAIIVSVFVLARKASMYLWTAVAKRPICNIVMECSRSVPTISQFMPRRWRGVPVLSIVSQVVAAQSRKVRLLMPRRAGLQPFTHQSSPLYLLKDTPHDCNGQSLVAFPRMSLDAQAKMSSWKFHVLDWHKRTNVLSFTISAVAPCKRMCCIASSRFVASSMFVRGVFTAPPAF